MGSAQDSPFILELDSPEATIELAGGKGASLARLATAGLPVPPGFHITTHAYRRFVAENHLAESILSAAAEARSDDPATLDRVSAQIQRLFVEGEIPVDLAREIRRAYGGLAAGNSAVAVRSSATAEDLPEMSFAGQQETYLNIHGGDEVLDAVQRCWASLWTARAIGYRARQGMRPQDVSLAVVVQELVAADVAGILFTANPLTGARDEAMINAAWGLGEAIVGGHVTPDTLVVDKQTGAIRSQEIAGKDVMTIRLPEGTREEPVPARKRKQAALLAPQAAELARLGTEIEQLYGCPMDIEWAMRDARIFIVQARPITALPEPRATLEWKLPRAQGRYGRSSVIELLPEPLSPLFASLALPFWNESMHALTQTLGFGAGVLTELVTINDYAYYDFGLSARQLVRAVLGLLGLIPRAVPLLRSAQARWAGEGRPRYAAVAGKWAALDLRAAPAKRLLEGASQIVKSAADHYLTIQSGILPVAYTSEMVFTASYNRLGKRKDDPPALTFLLGFDSTPIQAEKSLYDLATWARSRPDLAGYLTNTAGTEIAAACQGQTAPIADAETWHEFTRRFGGHLNRFGHAVYDLDFAKSLPADDPAPIVEALKYFLTGQARNPHERQAAAAAAREQATRSLLARLRGLRLRWFRWLVAGTQRYAPLREDALADVGLGWPILRRIFGEAGQRLVAAGSLAEPNDVYWLQWNELVEAARALDAGQPVHDYGGVVAQRRATWERERAVTPPVGLPLDRGMRFLGIDFSRWAPARTGQAAGNTIRGIGASPGRVAGAARVIRGSGEFHQMRPGDILVTKITTPAWTPLFALAAGVVTDVGGPLSHSSIVAREYHIPAVLGTGVATEWIRSGQTVIVDGDAGVVKLGRRD